MIENVQERLKFCKDRLHWAENIIEIDCLEEEIRILEIVLGAWNWKELCAT